MAVASVGRNVWMSRAPHVLSFARVLITIVAYGAAFRGDRPLFAVLVMLAVLTDILDGPLARASGTASRFGANLDSAADLIFYLSLPAWTYILRPEVVLGNLELVAGFTLLYIVANVVSHATFGALGVHNRLSRASGTAGVAFTFYSVLWGVDPTLKLILVSILTADLGQRYWAVGVEWGRRRRVKAGT